MLVYIQPHAFATLNDGVGGVGVWNMMTGDQVKYINIDFKLKRIKTNRSQVILSPCSCDNCGMGPVGSIFIFVFDASELSDPKVPAENVSWRELLHSEEVGNAESVEAAVNNTGIVAVFQNPEKQGQGCATTIKTLEFWRAERATEDVQRNSLGKMEREKKDAVLL